VVAKKKKTEEEVDLPVDLAARIGARRPSAPEPAPPMPPPAEPTSRIDGPQPPRRREGSTLIGMDEPAPPPVPLAPEAAAEEEARGAAIPSPRVPPGPGETDLVVTPLPTPDDWHRFELALRRIRGVGPVRPEYYRHGVLKVRVSYEGPGRLAHALRDGVPGYRVRVIGEDRSTLQILVSPEGEERRPG
jgi:hypothetical protein